MKKMSRIEYAEELSYALTEERCLELFNVTRESLNFSDKDWNWQLEEAYQNFIDNGMKDNLIGNYSDDEYNDYD